MLTCFHEVFFCRLYFEICRYTYSNTTLNCFCSYFLEWEKKGDYFCHRFYILGNAFLSPPHVNSIKIPFLSILLVKAKTYNFSVDTDWLFTDDEMDDDKADWRDSKWNKMSTNFHCNITELHNRGMMIDTKHPKDLKKTLKGRKVMVSSPTDDGKHEYYIGTIKSVSGKTKKGLKAGVLYDDYKECGALNVELKYTFWTGCDVWHETKKENEWCLLVKK